MGPGDLLPPEMSEYFGIDIFYLIIIVFFFGFITLRLSQKYSSLSKEAKSLDEVFLITIFGLSIAFRIHWLYRMWSPAFTKTELYLSLWIVPLFSILITVLIVLIFIYDAELIFNKKIMSRKPRKTKTYRLFKRGKPMITSEEIDKNIRISRFNVLLVGGLLLIPMIIDVGEVTTTVVLAALSLLFSFTPVISITIILYKRLTIESTIDK